MRCDSREGDEGADSGSVLRGSDWDSVGLQVQRDTIDELLRVQDSLEFRETEMERTRAELRSTKAEVTAMQGKLSAEFRYALPPPSTCPPTLEQNAAGMYSTLLCCTWGISLVPANRAA